MHFQQWFRKFILLVWLLSLLGPAVADRPQPAQAAPLAGVSAYELIAAMNSLRVSNGLPALIEDPIINAVAQSTAQTMAASQMSWHIGNVAGRLQSAGYGGGAQVYATENFATGNMSIDEIMVVWSDASHMIPAVNPAYCHVGAGVASSGNGAAITCCRRLTRHPNPVESTGRVVVAAPLVGAWRLGCRS